MQLVIDIPKEQYATLNAKTQKEVLAVIDFSLIIKAVKNGTPLLNTTTNGDMIQAMFPNEYFTIIQKIDNWGCEVCMDSEEYIRFSKSWWDAPYGGDADASDY